MAKTNYYYEYYWDITFRIPNRNIVFRPYSIVKFVKQCDYFNSFIPLYSTVLKIEDKDLNTLRMYDKELVVYIKLYMTYGTARESMTKKELIMEDTFVPYYDKEKLPTLNKENTAVKKEFDSSGVRYEPNSLMENMAHSIPFRLLRLNDLRMKKYIHNYVLGTPDKPATPVEGVSLIVEQNDYVKEYLMDPPDNNSSYENFIIEPNELKNAIKKIQLVYGIYAKGLELFYDSGKLYILNKLADNHVKSDDEINDILIKIDERTSNINSIDYSSVDDNKKRVYYQRNTNFYVEDLESIKGETVGDKIVFSNFSTVLNAGFETDKGTKYVSPIQEIERPSYSNLNTGTKKIIDYDMLNNMYNMSSYVAESALGVTISTTILSVNVNDFAPNKVVSLGFSTNENQKMYYGMYSISKCTFLFDTSNQPKDRYRTFAHATLELVHKRNGYDHDNAPAMVRDITPN